MEKFIPSPLNWDWPASAACQNGDPDALFVPGAEQRVAVRVCRKCPVRRECVAEALNKFDEHGVRGGLIDRQRRELLLVTKATGLNWWKLMGDFPRQFAYKDLLFVATGIAAKIRRAAKSTNSQPATEASQPTPIPAQRVDGEQSPAEHSEQIDLEPPEPIAAQPQLMEV